MQFNHRGYVSENPRIKAAAGHGINRPADIPDEMDVLIVGTGPAAVCSPQPSGPISSRSASVFNFTTLLARHTDRVANEDCPKKACRTGP